MRWVLGVLFFISCSKREEILPPPVDEAPWRAALNEIPKILQEQVPESLRPLYRRNGFQPLFFEGPRFVGWEVYLRVSQLRWDMARPDTLSLREFASAWARAESLRGEAWRASLDTLPDPAPLYLEAVRELARADVALARALLDAAQKLGADTASDPWALYEGLDTPYPEYPVLWRGHAMYSKMPDWARLSLDVLRPGDTGAAVRALQARLAIEGFYSGPVSGEYDSATTEAVREFQRYHGLDPDGVAGRATIRELNVPRRERLRQIREALRYWRRAPFSKIPGYAIRVNIPEFRLFLYDSGRVVDTFKVCVGQASSDTNWTPTLASKVINIVLNPRWNVPQRIFERELLEEIYEAGDVFEYLKKNRYEVRRIKGKTWLSQDPGERNALGRVKLLFPNPYHIYMHDTPIRKPFERARRDVSHGCIRVDRALELALRLLEREGWTRERFEEALNEKEERGGKEVYKERWVPLKHPVPVFIDYVLAGGDPEGRRPHFFPDIYRK